MNTEQLKDMLHRYRLGLCTEEEAAAISEWYRSLETGSDIHPDEKALRTFGKAVEKNIRQALQAERAATVILPFYRRAWFRYAAAVLLFGLGVGIYWLLAPEKQSSLSRIPPAASVLADLLPGGPKAVLTLADGRVILLDSAANGSLARQGSVKVIKLDNGRLAYSANQEGNKEIQGAAGKILYNTITTPRGGLYQVTLSDGTTVWLNAASSLRFPASFAEKERVVQITGEAYLEVARDAARPFKVTTATSEVEVLGTSFNVNAYADEAAVKTTLLTGKVKVRSSRERQPEAVVLQPGQQVMLNRNGTLKLIENADVEEAIAWRKGKFQFNSADIQTIMRQISRWYDIEVVYTEPINMHFSGNLNREVNASELFKKLSLTDEVRFEIKGNKVIVRKH